MGTHNKVSGASTDVMHDCTIVAQHKTLFCILVSLPYPLLIRGNPNSIRINQSLTITLGLTGSCSHPSFFQFREEAHTNEINL